MKDAPALCRYSVSPPLIGMSAAVATTPVGPNAMKATVVPLFVTCTTCGSPEMATLALVVVAAATAFRPAAGDGGTGARPGVLKLVPWFLWLFLVLVLLQSAHALPPAALPVAQLDNGFRNLIVPPLTLGFSLFFGLVNLVQLSVNLIPGMREVTRRYTSAALLAVRNRQILQQLRSGATQCVVGVNLLREGLDMPEVALVGILDADKEGFLRGERALIQTIGRAARHLNGTAILYADTITRSIKAAMDEMAREDVPPENRIPPENRLPNEVDTL